MALNPTFTSTVRLEVAAATVNTARDGSGTLSSSILVAPSAGTKVFEILLQATGDPADSVVTIFLHNGSTATLYDEFDIGNPAAASNTVSGARFRKTYDNLVLPSGWSIKAGLTVATTSGVVNVWGHGADLT